MLERLNLSIAGNGTGSGTEPMVETPPGPETVRVLWVKRYLHTSSWEQVTLVRLGLGLDGESEILS